MVYETACLTNEEIEHLVETLSYTKVNEVCGYVVQLAPKTGRWYASADGVSSITSRSLRVVLNWVKDDLIMVRSTGLQ